MLTILRGGVVMAALMLIGGAAVAQEPSSANATMPGCRMVVRGSIATNPFDAGTCAGIARTLLYFEKPFGICSPSNSNVGQFVRVIVTYVDERPARMHEDFMELAVEALRAAWPCKQ